jgi:O-acetyl-ADP-ribose deacetylase (regulator of RNase III)
LLIVDVSVAAKVAISTVKDWLSQPENRDAVDLIVFNTFTKQSTDLYEDLTPKIFNGEL